MTRQLHVHEDLASTAQAAASFLLERASACLSERGRFRMALAGGSTPRALYGHMRTWTLAWPRVDLCFGDERCVPPEHPDSNARMVREALGPDITQEACFLRIQGELPPEQAAQAYAAALHELFKTQGEPPRFDAVLLGLGADGHTASLFPHSSALAEHEAWVAPNLVAGLTSARITLTYPVLNAARLVVFLVSGKDKANAVQAVLEGAHPSDEIPARGVQPTAGELHFFLDRGAASSLSR
jgi:6-phosphogluconolactonase